MSYQLSDNGYKAVLEVGRWVTAAIALGTLYVTSSNRHEEAMAERKAARDENTAQLKAIEERLDYRPRPVFGEKP